MTNLETATTPKSSTKFQAPIKDAVANMKLASVNDVDNNNQPNLIPIKVEETQTTFDDSVKTIDVFGKQCEVEDEYQGYITVKEVKSLLPEMEVEKFQEFKKSMENGNIIPILYILLPSGYKLIIDGHHRFRASIELKLEKILRKRVGQDYKRFEQIITFVIKDQLHKRTLTPTQSLELAYKYKDIFMSQAKDNLSLAGKKENVTEKINTALEIGKLAGVGKSKAEDFILVFEKGSDELRKEMLEEEISVSAAAKSVRDERRKNKTANAKVDNQGAEINSKPNDKVEENDEDSLENDTANKKPTIETPTPTAKGEKDGEIQKEVSKKDENTKPIETSVTNVDREEPLEIIERLLDGELGECFEEPDNDFMGFIKVYGEIIIVNSYSDLSEVRTKFNNKGIN